MRVLTKEEKRMIRDEYLAGRDIEEISEKYGVNEYTIKKFKGGKRDSITSRVNKEMLLEMIDERGINDLARRLECSYFHTRYVLQRFGLWQDSARKTIKYCIKLKEDK